MPTAQQIEEAKAFVLRRVRIANAASNTARQYIMDAAMEIIRISYRYNIEPKLFEFSRNKSLQKEVSAVIAKLRDELRYVTEIASVSVNDEDADTILAHLHAEVNGKTLTERLGEYTDRYKLEIEAFVAAGLLFGVGQVQLANEIDKWLKKPYSSPLLQEAFAQEGMNATRIQTKGISYGLGQYVSSFNSIDRLMNYDISEAWMWYFLMGAKNNGAIGFNVYRGSSYPCSTCDNMVGFHTFEGDLPLYHGHCCCYAVPITL